MKNDDLEEIQLDKTRQKAWLIDIDDGYGTRYYDLDTNAYHHYVVPEKIWLETDDADSRCLDMTKSEDRMDICKGTDNQNPSKAGRKIYYWIEWFGQEDDDSEQMIVRSCCTLLMIRI